MIVFAHLHCRHTGQTDSSPTMSNYTSLRLSNGVESVRFKSKVVRRFWTALPRPLFVVLKPESGRVLELSSQAQQRRAVGKTNMNEHSSRYSAFKTGKHFAWIGCFRKKGVYSIHIYLIDSKTNHRSEHPALL